MEKAPLVRLYEAICELQSGPNPLTEEELDLFALRQPRFRQAIQSWRARAANLRKTTDDSGRV